MSSSLSWFLSFLFHLHWKCLFLFRYIVLNITIETIASKNIMKTIGIQQESEEYILLWGGMFTMLHRHAWKFICQFSHPKAQCYFTSMLLKKDIIMKEILHINLPNVKQFSTIQSLRILRRISWLSCHLYQPTFVYRL